MPTPARKARGRPEQETKCDACGCRRHDKVAGLIARIAEKHGKEVWWEPKVKTTKGLLKPDLVIIDTNSQAAVFTDVTIVADNAVLDREESEKSRKYDQEEVSDLDKSKSESGIGRVRRNCFKLERRLVIDQRRVPRWKAAHISQSGATRCGPLGTDQLIGWRTDNDQEGSE